MTRKYSNSNSNNQRNNNPRGNRGEKNRGRTVSKSTNNDLRRNNQNHNNNENLSQRTNLISQDSMIAVDADELERRRRRAERFEKFLDPQQLASTGADASLISNKINTNRNSRKGGMILSKDNNTKDDVKESIIADDYKELTQIDIVSNFFELLLLELRLIDLLSSVSSSPIISKSISNTSTKRQQRLKAHDWFIEKSPPIRLSELGYWDKLFLVIDMEYDNETCEIDNYNSIEDSVNEWVDLMNKGVKQLSIE
ncbi:7203_t:CDS:2 [Dentiscutata heterogama]|uniref:7203_t:CDS:1 n=1 Tax=Dentiscutata heterogama TaxID=1316150 RepID=A0ACA9LIG5_9GLOM|nr:7203_t:CDS:2 [Dentiscutata heterogama]